MTRIEQLEALSRRVEWTDECVLWIGAKDITQQTVSKIVARDSWAHL